MISRYRVAALLAAAAASWGSTSLARDAPRAPAPAEKAPGKLTKPPHLKKFVEPTYPDSEKATARKASVALALAIDTDGKVAEATVVGSGGDAFDAAAVDAAKQLEFEPAEIDGVPAPVRIQYRYDFELEPPTAALPTTADFGGVVRDRATAKPLAGVTVGLDNDSTKTDGAGHFRFPEAPSGVHSVTISGSDFTPVGTEETLAAGHKYDATYDVDVPKEPLSPEERVDFEVVVVDTQLEKSVASTSVSADQGGRVAGTGGDVIKVVENLPGVARSTVGSGALVVWGAGAADTRVYVDDVHVPVLYHEGGFRSVIHSDLVQNVELEPGGYGSAHGRGMGGLVNVGLKPLESGPYHGSVAVDAIDAAASVRGSIGDRFRFAGAVRRSHLDWVLARVTSQDVGEFVPIPKYWDSQLRFAYVPRDGESVEVGGLLSSDHISRSLVEADPADTKTEGKDSGFERVYLRYQRRLDDGGNVIVTPFFGLDHSKISSAFGAIPAVLQNDSTLYGLRAAWTGQPVDFLSLGVGIDAEVVSSTLHRQGSVTEPPREGDLRVFGQAPSDQVNFDEWKTVVAGLAPYAQADVSLAGGAVHLIPGARLEPSVVVTSRSSPPSGDLPSRGTSREDSELEPRFAAKWQATKRIKIRGAVGVYHQPPLAEDLSSVFGNPLLGPSKAVHYLAGAAFQLTSALSVEMTSFYSKQSELVTRSALSVPVQAQALIQGGLGRAYGTQILLRHDLVKRFFGWLSYSILRSERTDAGSDQYRPFDFDQTHVFTALGSYDLGAGFEVGARFRYSTGYPRTPVLRAVLDARTDTYEPVFGAHNSIRIPAFYQADVRVSKRFKFGESTGLEIYLDVQNVTDHSNPEEIVYNADYSKKSYITGLPILPVLGGKLTW
ncbi:MAG TPA: TonB-dependent receptor [Polyangiaceae bacterium]|jgi:TonB family protein|nr:TonB-dependent receptor [Polyangiaceae bacterium]